MKILNFKFRMLQEGGGLIVNHTPVFIIQKFKIYEKSSSTVEPILFYFSTVEPILFYFSTVEPILFYFSTVGPILFYFSTVEPIIFHFSTVEPISLYFCICLNQF